MQTLTLPEVGKTYQSSTDPDLVLLVEDVTVIEADPADGVEAGFIVEACSPDAADDMESMGYDFYSDEWQEHGFKLVQ